MTISEAKNKLNELGIEIEDHNLRRRIDKYLPEVGRNKDNNYRNIDNEEFKLLSIVLALEIKGKNEKEIEGLMDGSIDKVTLIDSLTNSAKIDTFLRVWIDES